MYIRLGHKGRDELEEEYCFQILDSIYISGVCYQPMACTRELEERQSSLEDRVAEDSQLSYVPNCMAALNLLFFQFYLLY